MANWVVQRAPIVKSNKNTDRTRGLISIRAVSRNLVPIIANAADISDGGLEKKTRPINLMVISEYVVNTIWSPRGV